GQDVVAQDDAAEDAGFSLRVVRQHSAIARHRWTLYVSGTTTVREPRKLKIERSCKCTQPPGDSGMDRRIYFTRLLVFTDDPELERRGHTRRQLHGHVVLAERLDRLIQLDPAVIDLDAGALQLICDAASAARA